MHLPWKAVLNEETSNEPAYLTKKELMKFFHGKKKDYIG